MTSKFEARKGAGGWRAAISVVGAMGAAALGCLDRPVAAVVPVIQSGISEVVVNESVEKVDLLLMVDNSGSMRDNQTNIMAQFGPLISRLTNPPCISRTMPGGGAPHACNPANMDDTPQYPAVKDLHVGVVSSDLGTPGSTVPGCDDSDRGDHGLLNPIRNGPALQIHLPWAPRRTNAETAPAGFRPTACNNNTNQFPSFISFCSNAADPSCDVAGMFASTRDSAVFADWFRCNAGLFVNGCGLESQIEAVWRGLVFHDATSRAGNTSPNAGFLREDALLAILMLTDEEDGSVRNCDFDSGFSAQGGGSCRDAKDVYVSSSGAWAHPTNPDLRFYLYRPGDDRDPTWNMDRYYNTAPSTVANRWTRDLLSLKPGHPERIVFAGIVGVPLAVPTRMDGTETRIEWDRLLGTPAAGNPNDFIGRNSAMSASGTQETAGPFSMQAANQDPMCTHVVPACRRQGSMYDPMRSCSSAQQMAFPSRRVVELARRFDEYPACNGTACRNGLVTSICSTNFGPAMDAIIQKIASRIGGKCLPRVLRVTPDGNGNDEVSCVVREILPAGQTMCDATRGRNDPEQMTDRTFDDNGTPRTVCDIRQISTAPMGTPTAGQPVNTMPGWYYDRSRDASNPTCLQRISFTSNGAPGPGTITRLECIQSVSTMN
ncbi:MAG: hypothetical protein Q8Q09_02330 [Deltaproteobacteria bacterium]|nr:hypothetical protein [Deltaproteobacteria bacterium]